MSRVVRVTVLAVALSSAVQSGCSSNTSGVHLQDPPPPAASTSSAAPAASASPAPQPPPVVTSTRHSTPISPASSPGAGAISPAYSATRSGAAASSSSTTAAATSSVTPVDPEAADRMAIEAVWTKYWITVKGLLKVPAGDRLNVIRTVAVPSQAAGVLSQAAKEEAAGHAEYGSIVHRPYWSTPVGGKSTAVMNDCMNDYNAGTLDVKTGKKLQAGVYRDNTQATFMKGSDGLWRVSKIEFFVNVPC